MLTLHDLPSKSDFQRRALSEGLTECGNRKWTAAEDCIDNDDDEVHDRILQPLPTYLGNPSGLGLEEMNNLSPESQALLATMKQQFGHDITVINETVLQNMQKIEAIETVVHKQRHTQQTHHEELQSLKVDVRRELEGLKRDKPSSLDAGSSIGASVAGGDGVQLNAETPKAGTITRIAERSWKINRKRTLIFVGWPRSTEGANIHAGLDILVAGTSEVHAKDLVTDTISGTGCAGLVYFTR